MENKVLSALALSILSSPTKLGLWDSLWDDPLGMFNSMDKSKLKTQNHLIDLYGSDPQKAAVQIYEKCIDFQFKIITLWDEDYPPLLKEIYKPPIVLFKRGDFKIDNPVSIVGTRSSDKKSEQITSYIAGKLVENGYSIVSGLALGIDRSAHIGAIKKSGPTIAILPNGLDVVYPYKNRDLFKMIEDSPVSGFLSEYPPGIIPSNKWTFAKRNRIISGISKALILTQAPLKSGAMITARYALEHNRDLFVCPGNAFDKTYEGCLTMLRDGATIAGNMDDILSGLDPSYCSNSGKSKSKDITKESDSSDISEYLSKPIFYQLDPTEKLIVQQIGPDGSDVDNVIRLTGISSDLAGQTFSMLEISGIIIRKGNRLFIKK